jgi:hypothetical protein
LKFIYAQDNAAGGESRIIKALNSIFGALSGSRKQAEERAREAREKADQERRGFEAKLEADKQRFEQAWMRGHHGCAAVRSQQPTRRADLFLTGLY